MVNYDFNTLLARYQRPGYFNDPDFLIPHHPDMSMDEKRSHFVLWASFSAPLTISSYIPSLSNEVISFLTNRDLIAVNQDSLAQQATLVSRDGTFDVLSRSLANGDRLLTVLNRGITTSSTSIDVERLGLSPKCSYRIKDLWDGSSSSINGSIDIKDLPSRATVVYRISLPQHCSSIVPTGMLFNTASKNCLTATSHSRVSSETCNGDDSQVWTVTSSGAIGPLSAKSRCLTVEGNSVSLAPCNQSPQQKWFYAVSGNLRNIYTGACLTEGTPGMSACGFEKDSQVSGLPSGGLLEQLGSGITGFLNI